LVAVAVAAHTMVADTVMVVLAAAVAVLFITGRHIQTDQETVM
jgi:hypothetical protein